MENKFFKTDQFSWEGDTLKLLRKGFVLEKIPVSEISFCEIKKARIAKSPLLLAGFGLVCLIPLVWSSIYWFGVIFQSKIDFSDFNISQGYHRALAIQIIVVGFCSFLGLLSFLNAFKKSICLEVNLNRDQKRILLDLELLNKSGRLKEFIDHLREIKIDFKVNLET